MALATGQHVHVCIRIEHSTRDNDDDGSSADSSFNRQNTKNLASYRYRYRYGYQYRSERADNGLRLLEALEQQMSISRSAKALPLSSAHTSGLGTYNVYFGVHETATCIQPFPCSVYCISVPRMAYTLHVVYR